MPMTIPSRSPTAHRRAITSRRPASKSMRWAGRSAAPNAMAPRPEDEITTRSSYDIRGNLLTVVDALGRTAFRYRSTILPIAPVRVLSIDAGIKRTVLDALGNAVEQRDSKGALVLSGLRRAESTGRPMGARRYRRSATRCASIWSMGTTPYRSAWINRTHASAMRWANWSPTTMRPAGYSRANTTSRAICSRKLARSSAIRRFCRFSRARRRTTGRCPLTRSIGSRRNFHRGTRRRDPRSDGVHDLHSLRRTEPGRREISIRATSTTSAKCLRPDYNRAGALESVDFDGDRYVERIAYNANGQRTLDRLRQRGHDALRLRPAYLPAKQAAQRTLFAAETIRRYQPTGLPLQDFGYEYDLAGNIVTYPGSNAGERHSQHAARDRCARSTVWLRPHLPAAVGDRTRMRYSPGAATLVRRAAMQ